MNFKTDIPIFIICRDRYAILLRQLGIFKGYGYENIKLIDNVSTYPPLYFYKHYLNTVEY